MDFKETFLKLTEYTIPFGYEHKIVPFLKEKINGLKKDSVGNYFIEIGNSETLFTTHLDTYSKKYQKVNHVIDGDWIATDGTTILGGDNKNGCTILMYLIENNIPGTYYFFIGEEPLESGGLYGSSIALKKNPDFFKKFKRAIAFDRKKMGSIVVRQMARKCCSDEFAEYLIDEFDKNGLEFSKDPNAYYTDTATFLNVIPEVTNISAGGWGEHTKEEKSLITYIEAVAKVAAKINWEDSPVVREAKKVSTIDGLKKIKKSKKLTNISKDTFKKVYHLFDLFGYKCLNPDEFDIDVDMVFSHWHKDSELNIKVISEDIYINNKKIGNFYNLKKTFNISFDDLVDIDEFIEFLETTDKAEFTMSEMDEILSDYYSNSLELIEFLKNDDELIDILEYDNNKFIII